MRHVFPEPVNCGVPRKIGIHVVEHRVVERVVE
jgi:hypothetical protein